MHNNLSKNPSKICILIWTLGVSIPDLNFYDSIFSSLVFPLNSIFHRFIVVYRKCLQFNAALEVKKKKNFPVLPSMFQLRAEMINRKSDHLTKHWKNSPNLLGTPLSKGVRQSIGIYSMLKWLKFGLTQNAGKGFLWNLLVLLTNYWEILICNFRSKEKLGKKSPLIPIFTWSRPLYFP